MRTGRLLRFALPALSIYLIALLSIPAHAKTPVEKRYVSTMTREMRQIGGTIIRFSYLIKHPQVSQQQWSDQIAVCCVQMRMYPSKVRKISVPKRYRAGHSHLTVALQDYSYVGYHFPHALDTQDRPEGLVCSQKLGKADDELITYGQALKAEGVAE